MKGRKPKPTALHLLSGNPGRRPLPPPDPLPHGTAERPRGLRGSALDIWTQFIARCWWLSWADSIKAEMFCHLLAEYRKSPTQMIAARIAQLRALASELGLDASARSRMNIPPNLNPGRPHALGAGGTPPNPADRYLS